MTRKTPADVGSLARAHTKENIQMLAGIARNGANESVKVQAIGMLLDRGWGKPKQTQEVTGTNGGPLEFIVRQIMEGSKPPKK